MSKSCNHCGHRDPEPGQRWCEYCLGVLARSEIKLSRRGKRRPYVPKPGTAMTPRETQVMRMVAKGANMKKAADELGIAHKSVHVYTHRARARLGGRSLVHLGCLLERAGIASGMDEMLAAAAAGVML